eukprot:SAG11_NODE_12806_length_684_cov_1.070085_2_plen_24_part_01
MQPHMVNGGWVLARSQFEGADWPY